MKKHFRNSILIFLVFAGVNTFAQQVSQFTQYYINPYIINPSLAGYSGETQAFFIRSQRNSGFESGNVLNMLSADGKVWDDKIGFGFNLYSDQMGSLSTQGANITLSYAVKFSDDARLGFGISGGVSDRKYDLSNVIVEDANDPMLQMGFPARKAFFDMNAGLFFDYKKFQIGVAVPQLIGNDLAINTSSVNLKQHLKAHFAYELLLSEVYELTLKPFASLMYVSGAPFQYDINAGVDMKRVGWVNIGWRSNYAINTNIGFHIKNNIHAGYAYHLVLNNTKNFGVSHHEILLGITFGKGGNKRESDALKKENERLQLELTKTGNERDSLMKLKTKAEVELRNEKANSEKLNDSLNEVSKTKSALETENEQLKTENTSLKKQIEDLKNSGGKTVTVPDPKTEEEKNRLKKENDELKKQIDELKNKNTNSVSTDHSKAEEENKRLKTENEDLKKQLKDAKTSGNTSNTASDNSEEIKKLKKENEELKKQINQNTSSSGNNSANNSSGNNSTDNSSGNTNNNNGNNSTNNSSGNTSFSGDIRKSLNDQFYEIDKTTDASKGYYVVSGAFGSITNAESFLAKQKSNFPDAKLIYNTRNNLHYVILGYSTDKTQMYPIYTKAKNAGVAKLWILDYGN